MISSGRQILVATALVAAVATVLMARVTAKGAGPLPQEVVPAHAARLAATAGTALIALSLVVLSYQSVAASIQTAYSGGGLLSEPGDLLRQWLPLGACSGPAGTPLGDWLLYRAIDVRAAASPLIEAVAARTAERGAGTRPRGQPVTEQSGEPRAPTGPRL